MFKPKSGHPEYLYKGLDPQAFPYYFQRQGIWPARSDKNWPWITGSILRAAENAHSSSLEGGNTCLAVIDAMVLRRGNLKASRCLAAVLTGNVKDYYGQELIQWYELLMLCVSQKAWNHIFQDYLNSNDPGVDLEDLAKKIVIVSPNQNPKDIIQESLSLVTSH